MTIFKETIFREKLLAGVLFLGALMASPLHAQQHATLEALLAAGEFGPAIAQAEALAKPAQRDAALARIAAAQSQAGARRAASHTASRIADDRQYAAALEQAAAGRSAPSGALGGGPQADFDSLIELITTTIAPDSWDEVGGPGAVDGFEGGVYVDAAGVLRQAEWVHDRQLEALRNEAQQTPAKRSGNWRRQSQFRKISLPRLERAVLERAARGLQPSEEQQCLAGLERVTHVLLYPETGDLVIAGPAGDFRRDGEGRAVSVASGHPVLQLDDLVVVLRNAWSENSRFGCSITPRQANLAATKAFLAESSREPLRPGTREKWLAELRETLGRQDIEVYGVEPRTRVGRVLIEADYRMKLVGMGLEEGVLGVKSYLASLNLAPGEAPPPMDVLRWWFTLNYHHITTTEAGDAFRFDGPGVQVKSENELLTELGQRVATGQSTDLNREFAHSFTQHLEPLAAKYPIYADLRNVFDLALMAALLTRHDLPAQVGWTPTHFAPAGGYAPQLELAPREVETVINHRLIGQRQIVAGVSGGVRVDPLSLLDDAEFLQVDRYGLVSAAHGNGRPPEKAEPLDWWWD